MGLLSPIMSSASLRLLVRISGECVFIKIMNRVEEMIMQALTTAHNNNLRQQAEKTVFTLLNDSPSEFFLTCANIVVD